MFIKFAVSALSILGILTVFRFKLFDKSGDITIYDDKAFRRELRHRRCGWKGHGPSMRPCPDNDTFCGTWHGYKLNIFS